MIQKVETLIIGAGVLGSSVAMHLARKGMTQVRVVDLDLEGSHSSSELNAGGVRATMSQPVNIRMSQSTINYFASVAEEVGYRPCGYLWLHRPAGLENALKACELQRQMGWEVETWDLAQLKRKAPLIDKTEDLAGAVFGVRDGLVNPNRLKNHFREQARKKGVIFDDRTWIQAAEFSNNVGNSGVRLRGQRWLAALDSDQKTEFLGGKFFAKGSETIEYQAERVINCAGPWAAEVARALGYLTPSVAVRRQISLFDARGVDLNDYGMIIDPSGVYFHPEATYGLAGFANHGEPPGYNYQYDGENFFMESIWPALYERSTHFEALKHVSGWAGLYEVSPDECAILGEAHGLDSSRKGRIFEAHSFSGHGVMHSYAAGLALAELLCEGRYLTLDVSELSGRRFETGQLIREGWVI